MAIEVISRKHPSVTKIVICRNCGAELCYTQSDTKEERVSDYTGSVDIEKVLYCPDCNHRIRVS